MTGLSCSLCSLTLNFLIAIFGLSFKKGDNRLFIFFKLVFFGISFFAFSSDNFNLFRRINIFDAVSARKLFVSGPAQIGGNLYVGGTIYGNVSGGGDVVGPDGAIANSVARFSGTTGKVIDDSLVTIDDSGDLTASNLATSDIKLNSITNSNDQTLNWPNSSGAAGTFLGSDGAGNLVFSTPAGSGNVDTALNFTTNNAIITVDLPSGAQNIKESTVLLDSSGNITNVNSLTATVVNSDLVGDVTGDVTGSASLNVLKAGDTMTGNLNMATQNALRLQDAAGGQYVGINAPATVSSSYTFSFPAAAPSAGQYLQASSSSATQWSTVGGDPATTKSYYVSKDGSDSNDGSFGAPFLTVSKAISEANGVANASTPVAIFVGVGVFTEDNSAGAIEITATNISIVGSSMSATVISPNTLSNDLFLVSVNGVEFNNMTLDSGGVSTATAIHINHDDAGVTRLLNLVAYRFQTAFDLEGAIDSTL